MSELKYVVTNQGDMAVFTKFVNHNDIGYKLYGIPVGAGFCNLTVEDGEVSAYCYGESISMELKSRGEEDEAIINRHINSM